MAERLAEAASGAFLRFYGIEAGVDRGPREWLEGTVEFIGKAKHEVKMVLGDDEVYVLGMALSGEKIPETWEEVQELMVKEKSAGEAN